MKNSKWLAASTSLLFIVVICCPKFVHAQSASPQTEIPATTTKNASELLTTLDQLIEQNRQLEKQNNELMEQANLLRRLLAQQTSGLPTASKSESETSAMSTVAQQNNANKQTAGQTGQVSTP